MADKSRTTAGTSVDFILNLGIEANEIEGVSRPVLGS